VNGAALTLEQVHAEQRRRTLPAAPPAIAAGPIAPSTQANRAATARAPARTPAGRPATLISHACTWGQIIQWGRRSSACRAAVAARAAAARPASPSRPNPEDLAGRVAALEDNERRQAELVDRMAAQQAQLSDAVLSLHRQLRMLIGVVSVLAVVLAWRIFAA
jgi:hypothetical protein